jgi:Fe/S biogenesis protein NfuA
MVDISEIALQKLNELMQNVEQPVQGIRIIAEAVSPLKAEYSLAFVQAGEEQQDDEIVSFDSFNVYIDPDSIQYVEGATLNYVENAMGGGFVVENQPQPMPKLEGPVADKLQKLLSDQINPALAMHGGFVQLIDVKDNRAYIELGGGCKGCGMVDVTLKQGIEKLIKESIPEISEIYDRTDHASGTNPYYQPSAK